MGDSTAFSGKNVLVTGAGGYIGSHLVKALAQTGVASLTLLELSELHLFELLYADREDDPHVCCHPIVGSVADPVLLDAVFASRRIDFIFHAAAYKHVELMELNPFAAIANNVLGTACLAKAALRHGCESMLLLSTDKAVKPHSVMGVSKRISELIFASLSTPACRMNALRLCNVLGSSGSFLNVFLHQAQNRKPLTLTDPDAKRYFIDIANAVAALLEAAHYQGHARVLLPQLSGPVRMGNLVSLINESGSGACVVIGLRPGEKQNEDLTGPDDQYEQKCGALNVFRTTEINPNVCEEFLDRLRTCVAERDGPQLLRTLCAMVPDYSPSKVMLELAGACQ